MASAGCPSVVLLCDGDESFPAMLATIHGAERTITLENFVFSTGTVPISLPRLAERA
jgi:hypothetical protein